MKASTFQPLIVGGLCLAIAGLSGELYNQYLRLDELQSTTTQRLQPLDILRHDLSTLKDAQEKLQFALNDLKLAVDTGEQQANTLDPLLDQWAQDIQELRKGLATRATEADMTALRARLEQAEQRLLDLKPRSPTPPATSSAPKPKRPLAPSSSHSPPFSVLAVESRAGEHFLATAPPGSRSLTDIRLLHSGEQIGAWRLKALEPRSALFAVTGQPDQTVPLP
jgi:hypothetical protein